MMIPSSIFFAPRLWPRSALMSFKALGVIFGLTIIYASLTPVGAGGSVPHADKLMHALAYAALTGTLRLGWPIIWGGFIIIGVGSLGIGLEIAQALFGNGRTGSLADAFANVFGAGMALVILYPFRKRG